MSKTMKAVRLPLSMLKYAASGLSAAIIFSRPRGMLPSAIPLLAVSVSIWTRIIMRMSVSLPRRRIGRPADDLEHPPSPDGLPGERPFPRPTGQ